MTTSRLWLAVIERTFADAAAPKPEPWHKPASKQKRRNGPTVHLSTREHLRQSARNWLLRGGDDFALVCDLAGFDPGFVRRLAMSFKERGWPKYERNNPKVEVFDV